MFRISVRIFNLGLAVTIRNIGAGMTGMGISMAGEAKSAQPKNQ